MPQKRRAKVLTFLRLTKDMLSAVDISWCETWRVKQTDTEAQFLSPKDVRTKQPAWYSGVLDSSDSWELGAKNPLDQSHQWSFFEDKSKSSKCIFPLRFCQREVYWSRFHGLLRCWLCKVNVQCVTHAEWSAWNKTKNTRTDFTWKTDFDAIQMTELMLYVQVILQSH